MKKLAASLLPLVIVACAKPWPKVEPVQVHPTEPTAAEWRTTDHLVVVTDASGTMAQDALLPDARAAAQSFIAGIPPGGVRAKGSAGYDASFIGFGGDARLSTDLLPIESTDKPMSNRSRLYATAGNLDPLGSPTMGGSTPLADVLREAGDTLRGKTGPAAVVVISDGRADDPAASLEAGRQLVSGYKGGELCIHTVHVGDDAEGRAHLGQLAALSTDGCGSTRNADSLKNMAALQDMERKVFFGAAPLPPVASAGPCDQKIVLHGVQFAFDSAKLSPESGPVLDVALNHLKECSSSSLEIDGHTCNLGTDAYNQGLSSRRADSVRQYLITHGIDASRLTAKGLGESQPVASNDTRDGRAQNRRVELLPK